MTEQTTKLGWTDRATFIGLSLTIIGFTWILHTEHREDTKKADERWYTLLEKIHVLDKEIHTKK